MINKANSLSRLQITFEFTDDAFFQAIAAKNKERQEEKERRKQARLAAAKR